MSRARFRHVDHTIREHPDTDVTYEAECPWCNWKAIPADNPDPVDVECLKHAGQSDHQGFRRIRTSFAQVVRQS
ncbi:DUF7848 domain-containing protein [Streptomyces sp. NPDC002536]